MEEEKEKGGPRDFSFFRVLVKYFLRQLARFGSDITTAGNSGAEKEVAVEEEEGERERDGQSTTLRRRGQGRKNERDPRVGSGEQSKRTGRLFMATILQIYELVPVESSGRRVFPVQNV